MFLSAIQKQTVINHCQDFNVTYCLLFGSFAEGTANDDSDIDLLVSIVPNYLGLQRTLKSVMGRDIDLIVSPTPHLVWGFGVSERLI
jgi:predicted nucleotidyltransferase